jgi:hypothetical protein
MWSDNLLHQVASIESTVKRPDNELSPLNVEITPKELNKKTSIVFVLIPSWSIRGPPYNLARLSALAEENGYKTSSIDLNIVAHNDHTNWGLDYDPWHTNRDWKWIDPNYYQDIHPHLEKHLINCFEQIKALRPTVVGFTQYYCNELPMDWLVRKIKAELPEIVIVVGGVNIIANIWNEKYLLDKPYDYTVAGDGEKLLIQVLDEIENNVPRHGHKLLIEKGEVRASLDNMPVSNYRDYDFDSYRSRGIDIEISKGCIAKCVFCNETHYWKFRERSGLALLNEVIFLYHTYKITEINFVDSLVNGDLKQLLIFAQGLIDNNIKVTWNGLSRCDKRMDRKYLQTLKDSGCYGFGLGIESGSDKVLKDINKKITVADVLANVEDSSAVGMRHTGLWFVGFPTESAYNYYETLVLNWNLLPSGTMACVSVNMFWFDTNAIITQDTERFDLIDVCYLGNSICTNYNNTKVHSLVKRKGLDILVHWAKEIQVRGHKFLDFNIAELRPTIGNFYKINYTKINERKIDLEENVDFDIIQTGHGSFADSLINDIFPILRIFWHILGKYDIEIHYNKEEDFAEYGSSVDFDFTAVYKFSIEENGAWHADFDLDYKQPLHAWSRSKWKNLEKTSSNTFIAERIARHIKTPQVPSEKEAKIARMLEQYKDVDFSFNYHYIGSGNWSN